MDLMRELDKKFESTKGNPAYPRVLLLGYFLYCIVKNMYKLSDLAYACKYDDLLRIFSCKESPYESTLRRFFRGCSC